MSSERGRVTVSENPVDFLFLVPGTRHPSPRFYPYF
jgi:hypothetical protein